LDTREKIVPLGHVPALLAQGAWVVIPGLFDPLTAVVANRLSTLADGRNVLAIVLDHTDALLTGEARAILIAALRDVQAVTIANNGSWRASIPESAQIRIIEDPEGERQRSTEFAEFVMSRQRAGNNE